MTGDFQMVNLPQANDTGPAAKAAPLFNNPRNKQQTALPLPATGDQTAPKGCPRQGEPCTADEGETPEPRERPGHAMRPAFPGGSWEGLSCADREPAVR
ncbi:hypothetical protein EMIT0324P_11090 [Pseudomonas chlororaphis]